MIIEKKSKTSILNKEDILGYGGHSIVYKNNEETCIKIYREKLSNIFRETIKQNYIDISQVPNLINNPYFLTPLKLSTDRNGILQYVEFPFLPYQNMWAIKREHFMTKKYLITISNMIKIIQELTNKGIVITDLKLANMLVDNNNKVFIIDNDFSVRTQNHDLLKIITELSKNAFMNNYKEKFSADLDENYNKYMLINMMALLLIDPTLLEIIWPTSSTINYETLKEINKSIQTDRNISNTFKQNFNNILNGNNIPDVSQRTIDDYKEVIMKKILKNK